MINEPISQSLALAVTRRVVGEIIKLPLDTQGGYFDSLKINGVPVRFFHAPARPAHEFPTAAPAAPFRPSPAVRDAIAKAAP